MKNILLILFLSFSAYYKVFAQNKKDNTIVVAENISIAKIKSILFSQAYIVESNSDTSFMTTQGKELKKSSISLKILIAKSDSTTYLKALLKPTYSISIGGIESQAEYSELYYGGMKGSDLRKGWEELERIASLLSSKPKKYIKQ